MAYRYERLPPPHRPYVCATCPYCNGTRSPVPQVARLAPREYWKDVLGSPRFVVAPMVDQSELPFRMLCRRYGATLAYTPMLHSRLFADSEEYRTQFFSTAPNDRPLAVQFCSHDADTLLRAAQYVAPHCDLVDINLGCPQGIARRGRYGAFLMEEWDCIHTMVHTLHVELSVPVSVKIRVFGNVETTLRYVDMLCDAGAAVVTVHGRTREMKGGQTGLADLSIINLVRSHIAHRVPIISNGNILSAADIEPNLAATGCDAVMSAEALLWDPRLFSFPKNPVPTGRLFVAGRDTRIAALTTTLEFLQLVRAHPPIDLGMTKAHLFKLVHHSLERFPHRRDALGDVKCSMGSLDDFVDFVEDLRLLEVSTPVDFEGIRQKEPLLKKSKVETRIVEPVEGDMGFELFAESA